MKVYHVCADSKPLLNKKQSSEFIKGQVKASIKAGIETVVIMPLWKNLKDTLDYTILGTGSVTIMDKEKYVGVCYYKADDIDFYLIDNMEYFYLDNDFGYDNDGERFTYFQYAVLESFKIIDDYPDILHLHDWYCGLIPHLLKAKYKYFNKYLDIKTVFTVSDIREQGIYPLDMEAIMDIGPSPILYLDGMINFLKAGIVEADLVTTTSKTFYLESKTKIINSQLRFSLRDREEDYMGILGGIDYDYYNPERDNYLFFNYDEKNIIKMREKNKEAFKKDVGFADTNCMLVGFSSDLTNEKGFDLIEESLEEIINTTDIMFYFIGEGYKNYEDFMYYISNKYPERVKFYHGRNSMMTHRLYASCDMILQPYRYEPFSQGQLVAMHYGAVIFAHEAGASKDFLIPYNQYTNEGNGFSFISETKQDFLKVLDYAYSLYRFDLPKWNMLIKNAYNRDSSWDHVIEKMIPIYQRLIDENKTA